jgi:hypothetical protein
MSIRIGSLNPRKASAKFVTCRKAGHKTVKRESIRHAEDLAALLVLANAKPFLVGHRQADMSSQRIKSG